MTDIYREVRYRHTIASWGAEIVESVNGQRTECSIVNPRGTDALWFSMKIHGTWTASNSMIAPERFMPTPCRTHHDFVRVVEAWNAASDEQIARAEEAGNL